MSLLGKGGGQERGKSGGPGGGGGRWTKRQTKGSTADQDCKPRFSATGHAVDESLMSYLRASVCGRKIAWTP